MRRRRSTTKHEIEVKLRVKDLPSLLRRLQELGGRMGKRWHESNQLFDTSDGQLRRRDEMLRLRRSGGACVATFKGPALRSPQGRAGKYKVRMETEFAVAGFQQATAVIRRMGLQESFRYEKYRTEIHLPGSRRVHICLDETPMGAFLEIEGAPASIDVAARRMGYSPADYVTKSYLALWGEHCRRQGQPFGDFLFAAGKQSRKTSVLH